MEKKYGSYRISSQGEISKQILITIIFFEFSCLILILRAHMFGKGKYDPGQGIIVIEEFILLAHQILSDRVI